MDKTLHKDPSFAEEMLSVLGVSNLAYIKQTCGKSGLSFSVYAADGTRLATFASREAAEFTAKQHDLQPMSVH